MAGMSDNALAATRGEVTANGVNVRAYAEINNTNRLMQVNRGQALEVLDADGEFFRINIEGTIAYISQQFVRITFTHGSVTSSSTPVYNLPLEEGGEIIAMLHNESLVAVTATFGEWFAISFAGETAFIEQSLVHIPSFVTLPQARIGTTLACEIIANAMNYIGAPYAWGGMSPSGFDCSGFVIYLLRPHGVTLSRRSVDMASNGTHVDRADIVPGDLLFFATAGGRRVSHVGLYIGGGEFIHATTWGTGVRVSDLNSDYNTRTFVTARRVLP